MRRLSFAALALLAAGVVACSSAASAPGWTYAPAPSTTPAPSGSASAAPSASASAAPSATATAQASASGSASAAPSGGGTALTITAPAGAATTGFDPAALEGPANTAFSVTFDNQDTTTGPHNWVLKDASGTKIDIGDTTFFQAPAQKTYQIPALAPGDYPFDCEVHPAVMKGTLTIK
jgi:plastocyanin